MEPNSTVLDNLIEFGCVGLLDINSISWQDNAALGWLLEVRNGKQDHRVHVNRIYTVLPYNITCNTF